MNVREIIIFFTNRKGFLGGPPLSSAAEEGEYEGRRELASE